MKATLITSEFPYPPVHGGRVDVWRRLCAMHSEGVEVQLVSWTSDRQAEEPTRTDIGAVESRVHSMILLPIVGGWHGRIKHTLRSVMYPYPVSQRTPTHRTMKSIVSSVNVFNPDIIMLDGLFAGRLAISVARMTNRPLVSRSQNIEHKYVSLQAHAARSMREKLRFMRYAIGIERFEIALLRECSRYFDISMDDLNYWRNRGITSGIWLPPFIASADSSNIQSPVFDVGYLGNLYTPNNIEGLCWFVNRVIPMLGPGIRIVIAGSNPSPDIENLCRTVPNITLIPNPTNASAIYNSCRVLINPIFGGSGVNIKSIEMLATSVPLVSTPQGVKGLPPQVVAQFLVASSEEDFARHIMNSLQDNLINDSERQSVIDTFFGRSAIKSFISELKMIASLE